jgi:hypothetical protein
MPRSWRRKHKDGLRKRKLESRQSSSELNTNPNARSRESVRKCFTDAEALMATQEMVDEEKRAKVERPRVAEERR